MTAYDVAVLANSPLVYLRMDDLIGAGAPADLGSWGVSWVYGSTANLQQAAVNADGGKSVSNDNSSNTAIATGNPPGSYIVPGYTLELMANMGATAMIALLAFIEAVDAGSVVMIQEWVMSDPTVSAPGRDFLMFGSNGGLTVADVSAVDAADHHYACSLDSSGVYVFYMDGVAIGSPVTGPTGGPYDLRDPVYGGPISVGGYTGGALEPNSDSRFSSFAIYPTALSSGDIAAHAALGLGPASPFPFSSNGVGHDTIAAREERRASVASHGVGTSRIVSASVRDRWTEESTLPGASFPVQRPVIVSGRPMLPEWLADLHTQASLIQGPKNIRAIPDPRPVWNPYTGGWYTPPPPTSVPWSGRWCVDDLPDPGGGFYWLGEPSPYDGTEGSSSATHQWNAHASSPRAPAWQSVYPFKPSVTAMDHYLQGGGVVHHPKAINFNSHFIEHMWMDWGRSQRQPFTWVIAGMVASWPNPNYVHYVLDGGQRPAITLSAEDCNNDYQINELETYRNALTVSQTAMTIAASTSTSDVARAQYPARLVPQMFVGIFNGASSYVGSYSPYLKRIQRGTLDTTAVNHEKYVLGRQHGWLSQNRASHLLIFELRYWNEALTSPELEGQYSQLSSTYQFARY